MLNDPHILLPYAARYIWWKRPDEAIQFPYHVIAQVMDIGDYDDVVHLFAEVGETVFRNVLQYAEAGQFSPRSWAFWHYRLGLAELNQVPPLPQRNVPEQALEDLLRQIDASPPSNVR